MKYAFAPPVLFLAGLPSYAQDTVVPLKPCDVTRHYNSYFVKSSAKLVRMGAIDVDGEAFGVYLPETESGYRVTSFDEQPANAMTQFSSTYLAVDQNHDGKLTSSESAFAELPLRIGDTMFDVVAIAEDGSSITLRPNDGPLRGAVIGRRAPDFSFTATDGKVVRRDDYLGRAVLIDCWAPS